MLSFIVLEIGRRELAKINVIFRLSVINLDILVRISLIKI